MEFGMSHQDQSSVDRDAVNYRALKRAVNLCFTAGTFVGIAFRAGSLWLPSTLAACAMLWAWSDERTLTERFRTARKIVCRMFPALPTPPESYQAFMKILRKWSFSLVVAVAQGLRDRMETDLARHYRVAGFVVFGVDGSRFELARTLSNEEEYSPQRKVRDKGKRRRSRSRQSRATAKKVNSPQMWVTTMWHAGTGLPWDWRTGPSDSSERAHLLEMIGGLPTHSLVTADAGFVGYDYWHALLLGGHHFVIRVGSNVHLLKKLGVWEERHGRVYLWPDEAARKHRPPLVLRLVVVKGKRPVYLVTSVLDHQRLSDQQVIEIYRLRWGVELWYRGCKQTFERRKLRSHRAEHARIELDWSMLGLWAVCLLGLREQIQDEVPPKRLSVAGVLRAVRRSMREYRSKPEPGEDMWTLLRAAITDDYERHSKKSRDYPRKNHNKTSPPGKPRIRNATARQKKLAGNIQPLRLTA
jgi:hypothetical protein